MTVTDPFAVETPAESPWEPEQEGIEVPVKPVVVQQDEGKVVVTLKGGVGFDDPWIVIHAKDLPDALDQVTGQNARTLADLMAQVQRAANHFTGAQPANQGAVSNAPAPAQEAPAGSPEKPAGWAYRSGVSKKNGKPWQGYFPPRGDDSDPIFF